MNAVRMIGGLGAMLVVASLSVVAAEEKESKAEVHTVRAGRFRVVVPLDGAFVSQRVEEVSLRPETWSDFTVIEAVDHGQKVRKGDLLVRLDRRKIEEQIRDERTARKLAELAIEQLQAELAVLEPSVPIELAAAERAKKTADADLDYFLNVERDMAERSANLQVQSSQMRVDFAREELEQLEKMYEADDLTEETEELILKRTRKQLEISEIYLEMAKTRRDHAIEILLPRQEAAMRELVERQHVELEKARSALPLSVTKMQLDLEKQQYELAKATEKLDKLERDAALLTVAAPADGIVYFGECVDGQWTTADAMRKKLRRGGKLWANEVFITVVNPKTLRVRVGLPEEELCRLTTATSCRITPVASGHQRLNARIEHIPLVPGAGGKFAATVKLDGDDAAEELHLAPGMKCKVAAIAYDAEDVVSIPLKALHTDKFDDQQHFVHRVGEDDDHRRQDVTVGQRGKESVEIVSGLAAGDEILLDAPAENKD